MKRNIIRNVNISDTQNCEFDEALSLLIIIEEEKTKLD